MQFMSLNLARCKMAPSLGVILNYVWNLVHGWNTPGCKMLLTKQGCKIQKYFDSIVYLIQLFLYVSTLSAILMRLTYHDLPCVHVFFLRPESTKKVRKSLQRVGFKMRLALLKMIGMKTGIVAGNSWEARGRWQEHERSGAISREAAGAEALGEP